MWEKLKGTGAIALGFAFIVGVFLFIGLIVRGGAWLSVKAYPWLQAVSALTLLVMILVLLPLSAFRRTRAFAGNGFVVSSYIFGVTLWVWGFLLTYVLWGAFAVIVGLFLLGVGVVPIAMLATATKGMWPTLGELVFLTMLVFGSRFFGIWLLSKTYRGPTASL